MPLSGEVEVDESYFGGKRKGMSGLSGRFSYVLITPARNEEDFIEKTIQSMVSQSVLPKKWVIVSDGSTDRTDELVKKYLSSQPWMELLRMPERRERHFAAKATCFHAGHQRVKGLNYDVIGNLDADISFEADFMEYLLAQFEQDPSLGVAGTPFLEGNFQYDYNYVNIEHVSGQAQLFRRQCFEDIGGYIPIKGGGIDMVAVTTARMQGWKTRTFTERMFIHHKPMGTGDSSVLRARFRDGKRDYYLGGHPLWEMIRCLYKFKSKPYILCGLFLMSGYLWAYLNGVERPISPEFIRFHRKEQMERLKKVFLRIVRG